MRRQTDQILHDNALKTKQEPVPLPELDVSEFVGPPCLNKRIVSPNRLLHDIIVAVENASLNAWSALEAKIVY